MNAMVDRLLETQGLTQRVSLAPDRGRVYTWALSTTVVAELRIVGEPLTKADAGRLSQYVDLTCEALVVKSSHESA
jgi:hypothetical protein